MPSNDQRPKTSGQSGQAAIMILIGAALIIGFTLTARNFPPNKASRGGSGSFFSSKGCTVYTGSVPVTVKGRSYWSEKYLDLADENPSDLDETLDDRGDFVPTSNKEVNYELRAVNVPIFMKYISDRKKTFDDDLTGAIYQNFLNKNNLQKVSIGGREYMFLYPKSHGRLHGVTGGSQFRPVKYGLIYLAHLDEKGKIVIIDKKDLNRGSNYVLVDVYQDPSAPAIPDKFIEECQDARDNQRTTINAKGPIEVIFPDQNKSQTQDQLQLEYFLFQQGPEKIEISGVWTIHCKPAIYLYPPENLNVNVKVKTKGQLTYTDPPYPDGGWDVMADPDGKLYLASRLSPLASNYLYYESKIPDELINVPDEGYTVAFTQLSGLYRTILPKLGLNEAQIKDFISYWSKALPYSPYYFVGIMDQTNINSFEPLEITPKPDGINRVRLYFKALDKKPISDPSSSIQLPNSTFHSPSSTFQVIEWGGMFKSDPLHPFTCSQ